LRLPADGSFQGRLGDQASRTTKVCLVGQCFVTGWVTLRTMIMYWGPFCQQTHEIDKGQNNQCNCHSVTLMKINETSRRKKYIPF
jgi:hypothetical protein